MRKLFTRKNGFLLQNLFVRVHLIAWVNRILICTFFRKELEEFALKSLQEKELEKDLEEKVSKFKCKDVHNGIQLSLIILVRITPIGLVLKNLGTPKLIHYINQAIQCRISRQRSFPILCHYRAREITEPKNHFPLTYSALLIKFIWCPFCALILNK